MIYAIAGIAAVVAGLIIFLMVRSNRAGRAEAQVKDADQKAVDSSAEATKAMDIADTSNQEPSDTNALIAKLVQGKEGQ